MAHQVKQLVRGDELVPLMGAFGQPAHHVFGANDGHGKAFGISVDGRADVKAAGFQQLLAGGQIGERIGHVLDNFHVEHDVELLAVGGHVLGGSHAVIDGQARLFGVNLRHGDVARGGIDAHDCRPKPGHRLAQQTAAAADVENAQAFKRGRGI